MRSLLRLALALVASTQLVACVAGDNSSGDDAFDDQIADDTGMDIKAGGMMSGQLARDNGMVGLENTAQLQQQVANADNGIVFADGKNVAATRRDAVEPTDGVDIATVLATLGTKAGAEHVGAKPTVDGTPSLNVPGRTDSAHVGL